MKTFIKSLSLLPLTLLCLSGSIKAQTINAFAGNHTSGHSGDGGSAVSAQCFAPAGAAVDASGNVYFCELGSSVVRKVTPAGIISTFAGTGVQGFSGNGGPATAAMLNQPTSVATDAHGNVFFTDDGNNMIRKVDASGTITTVAGDGTAGFGGNYGPAIIAQLNGPSGIGVDSKGNLYIADVYNHAVRKVDSAGIISTLAGGNGPGFTGNTGPAISAGLYFPKGIAVDTAGNVFIVDQGNNCVRKVNTSGIIAAYAGNDTVGYSGDGGYGYKAKLNTPTEAVVDRKGNVYIADFGNHVIRKVSSSGFISTYAGNGTSGYSGDGGSALAAQMVAPYGVAVNNNGKLYITDEVSNVVRVIDMTTGINGPSATEYATLNVYPNPSHGAMTIALPATTNAGTLTITDMIGRTIQTCNVMASNAVSKLDVSGIPTGTYIVKLSAGEGIFRAQFIVW